jgi:putative ABC transport system permease protein
MKGPAAEGSVLGVALKMLLHKRARFVLTNVGIAAAFFLSAAQVGLMVGWCNTCSAIVRHAGVDVWAMAPQTPAFDYGTAIPRHRVQQVRNAPGVAWAEGMFMAWNIWQRPDGRRVNVELVGLDDGLVGRPWEMRAGAADAVFHPDTVIVDELYLSALGVGQLGDEVEMIRRRAVVGGISGGVRTLTASPFVFTSIKSAVRYDKRYRDDEITYVLARCAPGHSPEQVRDAVAREVPHVEVLTTREFAVRTMKYWLLETGLGITVVITAVLGLAVGGVIISQTLFAVTQDHLGNYATLLAVGFGRAQLCAIVVGQSLVLGAGGVALGGLGYLVAARLSAPTPIPLETTPLIFASLAGLALLCCGLASFVSVRALFRLDPVAVFKV